MYKLQHTLQAEGKTGNCLRDLDIDGGGSENIEGVMFHLKPIINLIIVMTNIKRHLLNDRTTECEDGIMKIKRFNIRGKEKCDCYGKS